MNAMGSRRIRCAVQIAIVELLSGAGFDRVKKVADNEGLAGSEAGRLRRRANDDVDER